MIQIHILICLLITHWVADFVLQTQWMAANKWNNYKALLAHTVVYSLMFFSMAIWLGTNIFAFLAITFAAHTLIDYCTSKVNHYLWKKKDVHNFFVSIGFDQLLHIVQLVLTYKLLADG